MTAEHHRDKLDDHPPLTCWFCDRQTAARAALEQSILMSREPRLGGPYRIFTCPHCLKDSMCEKSLRGRWFASPNMKLGLLDYVFLRGESEAESEKLLKAISWLRENEERRRYFFERDGDYRYGGSFLKSLWPWGKEKATAQATAERARAEARERRRREAEDGRRRRKREGAKERREERDRERAAESPRKPRLMTPHEILGVKPDATLQQIERRFYRLAVQYHPDKVHHMGEEFRVEAHKKFVLLQRAYEALKRREERE